VTVVKLALALTLGRIFIAPIFLILYLYYDALKIDLVVLPYILIFLLAFSELSDLFDGFLARRYNQVTELGKILDPMADTIVRLSVLFTFTQGVIQLPLILVLLFFYRETIIGALRTICALKGVALAARFSGKIKAVILAIVTFLILFLMIFYSVGYLSPDALQQISFYMVCIAALYTLYSGWEYIKANQIYIKKAFTKAG
jgi:CDP-diacylglycerol--glycerol-3-phosphate 3-phosphatidyltransferase